MMVKILAYQIWRKKSLVNYVHSLGISNDVVMITKGADEVALSLLANFVQTKTNYQPKVYVEYNDEKAMRHSYAVYGRFSRFYSRRKISDGKC